MVTNAPFKVLTEEECWNQLTKQHIGRLVTWIDGLVDITPLNYVVDGDSLVFRTAAGNKLSKLTIQPEVLLEVDDIHEDIGWSVVVRGEAHRIELSREIADAETLPLKPMVATLKLNFVRITPTELTGREFYFGEEPNREAFQEG